MRSTISGVAVGLALVSLMTALWHPAVVGVHAAPQAFHVSATALPAHASIASPTPIEGRILTTDVNPTFLTLANRDTSSHTVTIRDCGTPIFTMYDAYPIAATTTWHVPLGDTRFRGCFKWSATGLSGTDLVIDGTLNTKVTSATHNFTSIDVGLVLSVSAGTGFTVGSYTISSVAANAATLSSAVGTVSSTGGTWALPVVLGTLTGTR